MKFTEIISESSKICPQCGMKGCTCAPGKCNCKPKPGYPKKMDEAANPAQQAAIAIAKKKKQGVAEGIRDDAMAGLQKTVDFAKQHGYKIYRSPTGRKMRFVNPQLNHEIRAQVDNDGDSINVNFMDYYTGMSGNEDASYFYHVFKDAYEEALDDYQNRRSNDDEDDDGPYTTSQLKMLQKKGVAEGSENLSIGQQMAKDGITYSPEKENELINLMSQYMKKAGMSSKAIRYYLSYDEDFIPDQLSELPRQGVAEGETWSKHNNPRAGGMSKKSVASYRRSHPGSKIQTAVTKKPSKIKKGSKDAKRRASFCARMRGMKKHRTSAKTARDPNSNINKSLRRWHCESIEELHELVMLAEQFIRNNKK